MKLRNSRFGVAGLLSVAAFGLCCGLASPAHAGFANPPAKPPATLPGGLPGGKPGGSGGENGIDPILQQEWKDVQQGADPDCVAGANSAYDDCIADLPWWDVYNRTLCWKQRIKDVQDCNQQL